MAFHKQVRLRVGSMSALVDEKVAPLLRVIWKQGLWTWTSCQHDGPPEKKFPMYINPFACEKPPRGFRYTSAQEIKELLGLPCRIYNNVIWLHENAAEELRLIQERPDTTRRKSRRSKDRPRSSVSESGSR